MRSEPFHSAISPTRAPGSVDRPGAPNEEVEYVFPQSFAQQQLWLLDQLLPNGSVYNVSSHVRLNGRLDVDALRQALQKLVQRHEVLRTRFDVRNGLPVQLIAPEGDLALKVDDLSTLPAPEREAGERARAAARQPFDLARGPLLRASVLRLGDAEHWLQLTLHHIVTDGWSLRVLWKELSALYASYLRGEAPALPELPVQYADYAVWQRERLQGEFLAQQLAFWKGALADLPALELPTDRPRPAFPSYRGARVVVTLEDELVRSLKELGRQEGATLFMTLLAAVHVMLSRYCGQDDVAVGVPIVGRAHPEAEGLIGYFVNMLVLRGDLSAVPSFREYLRQVRERALAAYSHQELPFASLVEELAPRRDASRNPLFQVSFAQDNLAVGELELPGIEITPVLGISSGTAKFDLDFAIAEREGKVDVTIEYATDLFDAATIERMAGHWQVLLESIAADPQEHISQLPLLTDAEVAQLERWNATAAEYPRDGCLHELFEAQVRRTPEATALVFENERMSYAELNARTNRLAHYLRTLGVGPEKPVAIAVERSPELLIGLLAILKAGGAYVPLDPTYPSERLGFMLMDARALVLLTHERLRERLPAHGAYTVYLDALAESLASLPEVDPPRSVTAENLAYVIYTSGSTGQPKGVMVEHRSVVNYLTWIGRIFPLEPSDRVLHKTPISFDAAAEEIFFPLVNGAAVVIAGAKTHRSVTEMIAALREERISVLQVVPSLLGALLDQDGFRACDSLRLVLCGADVLPTDLARRLREQSSAELVNLYGPTETTISSTYCRYRPEIDSASVPIGIPIANTRTMVLDRAGQLVPVGVPGELWIGGDGVARGYLNRPELTEERFVAEPSGSSPKARLYRTGDRVRRTADGSLDFLGRDDRQVKIGGFRIELAEIDAALRQHEAIHEAVVLAREDRRGTRRLVAYTVPTPGRTVSARDLRRFLLSKLPEYMVPASFEFLEVMPLGTSGKIDRAALAAMPQAEPGVQERIDPRNAVEVQLMRIWERILDVSHIGMQDNFFALGGDSLAAVRVVDRIEQLFGRELPPDVLWYGDGTIESLAQALLDHGAPPVWSGPVALKASGKRRPLFCPHIVGGHLFFYDNLARHLHQDQPLYGLPARGFDGRTPPDSRLDAMAAHCIDAMKQVQPKGPYLLAGYCSGALIAFEMAQQLRTRGEVVDLLALCDSLAPGFHLLEFAQTAWDFLRLRNMRIVQQRLYRFVLQNLGLGHLRKFRTVTEAHFWALLAYRPQPYRGHAILFRASHMDDSRSPSLGWKNLVAGGLEICLIEAGHGAMVREPTVRVLAEQLERHLARAGREAWSGETTRRLFEPGTAVGL
ncbi:MAG TPA: amino acid adenylation domain-containing protein [Casimicrobiaceae bacterium]